MTTPDSIMVRHARARDEPALAAIEATSWSPMSGFPSVIERDRQRSRVFFSDENPPGIHLVAEMAGTVVGYKIGRAHV